VVRHEVACVKWRGLAVFRVNRSVDTPIEVTVNSAQPPDRVTPKPNDSVRVEDVESRSPRRKSPGQL
jgi:hypothetical protein